EVHRDVGRAPRTIIAPNDVHHRHGGLRGDAAGTAEQVAVQHHVTGHEDAGAGEIGDLQGHGANTTTAAGNVRGPRTRRLQGLDVSAAAGYGGTSALCCDAFGGPAAPRGGSAGGEVFSGSWRTGMFAPKPPMDGFMGGPEKTSLP